MAKLTVEIVTAERVLLRGQADMVVAPGVEGDMGILPRHMRLLTALRPGELRVINDGEESVMAVAGGFLEVTPQSVTVLADAAERSGEIDLQRAQEAMEQARRRLEEERLEPEDRARAFAAIRRAQIRLRVGRRRRRAPGVQEERADRG